MPIRILRPSAVTVLALLVCTGANAQYVWLDENGRRQYSDMAPPASVPAHKILKQPAGRQSTSEAAPAPVAPITPVAEAASEATPQPPTLAEREADFRKRRAEQAEKAKQATEEAQRAADNKKRCEQARSYQRTLESGERVVRYDKNGERIVLNDQERAAEMREAKRVLQDCK